jgi:hypothetical protein
MKGIGKTVFLGVEVEEFEAEILGVLENFRPQQNVILARLRGETVERTGVFAGMSGSPVYIDGRLIGAVAFSFAFSKEPIAGITPINEMVEIFRQKAGSLNTLSALRPVTDLYEVTQMAQVLRLPSVLDGFEVEVPQLGASQKLTPILTPVSFSGLSQEALRVFAPQFRRLGLLPVSGIGSGRYSDFGEATLEPGSTLSVQLIRGDLDSGASGTVTHVTGNKVYAFGHPFLGAGYTDLPMNKGAVVSVIPSLSSSQKIAAIGEPIGSIRQDRATGVLGITGEVPSLIPIQVKLKTSRNEEKIFSYEVVENNLLSPLLMTLAVFNSLNSSERTIGAQTLKVVSKISVKGQPEVRFENSVSDLVNSTTVAALAATAPVSFLLSSGFEGVEVEQVEVEITAVEQTRTAVLEKIWVDKGEVKPGEEVKVTAFIRKPSGETTSESFPVKIPEQMTPGPVDIIVGEGLSLARVDSESGRAEYIPENVRQLIRAINNLKKNDRLYIRLYRDSQGMIVGGEGLPELPPSLLELYGSKRTSGTATPLGKVIYFEHELPPTDFVLEGHKTVQIMVRG